MYEQMIFWMGILLLSLFLESITVSLVTIWFACGAACAMAAAYFNASCRFQTMIFFVVSMLLIITLRNVVAKKFNKNRCKTNTAGLIGKHAIITEEINNLTNTGRVRIEGLDWAARSSDDSVRMEHGEIVIIRRIEGVKLITEKITEKE